MRFLTLLLLAVLTLGGILGGTPARAANPAHLADVLYADGAVTLQFTEPTSYRTTYWESERRFIVDVEATGIDLHLTSLPVRSANLESVRWKQWKKDSVRVVLDLVGTGKPVVLASPPTNVITIRVARPGVSLAAPPPIMDPEPPAPHPVQTPTRPVQTPTRPVQTPARPMQTPPRPVQTPSPAPARPDTPVAPPLSQPLAQIGDIEIVRSPDGRPERILVHTDRDVSTSALWWGNHLAVDMPEAAGARERIIPVNDPTILRVRTGTYKDRGRVVVDATGRIGYKLSALDDGPGFALDLSLSAPEPAPEEPPAAPDEPAFDAPVGDALRGKVIVLDPGHGDFDKGARGPWIMEKTANLDIAQRLRRVLESVGAQVVMTRTDDTFVPLRERPAVAMRINADAFVSIHCNSSARPTNAGTEIFYRRGDAEARRLATCLYRAHRSRTGLAGRGVKPDSGAPQGGLAVLKHTTVPCALVEVAFLNHPTEGRKLADPAWRQTVAEGLARGLARYMEGRG